MMDLPDPIWCSVRGHYCRCEYSERCDRYDRDNVVEELKKEPPPLPQPERAKP